VKDFAGKVAAITGAGSGIGRALALELAEKRCDLAISDIGEKGLDETAQLASKHGVKVTKARVDVSNRAEVHAWADRVVGDHGKVNLVFNNAGVALGATLEDVRYEDFEWIVGINFWGVVYGTKAFLPHLRASGDGHVINVSSVFGIISVPTQGCYNATKFAVRGFTEALREELDMSAAGVSATCVHPGGIRTNIARAARIDESTTKLVGKDVESARAAFDSFFLTSPEAAARAILRGVRRNSRRVLIGVDARAIDLMQRLLPTSYQFIVAKLTRQMS